MLFGKEDRRAKEPDIVLKINKVKRNKNKDNLRFILRTKNKKKDDIKGRNTIFRASNIKCPIIVKTVILRHSLFFLQEDEIR